MPPDDVERTPPEHVPQPDAALVRWKPPVQVLESLRVDPADVVQFLAHLAAHGNVARACRRCRVSRPTVYRMRRELPDFREAWDNALEEAADNLEAEAYRRAVEGVERPVYQGGTKVGSIREFSDRLLLAMLRTRNPAYREALASGSTVNVDASQDHRKVEVNVGPQPPDGPHLVEWVERLGEVTREQAPRLHEGNGKHEGNGSE